MGGTCALVFFDAEMLSPNISIYGRNIASTNRQLMRAFMLLLGYLIWCLQRWSQHLTLWSAKAHGAYARRNLHVWVAVNSALGLVFLRLYF
jgi:hypothetical protein